MDVLTFLGTACGLPMTDRFHSSLLLEADGRRWLLDAGEPCSHRLKALEVPFSSLDAVLISHGHSDHLSGLPMVLQGAWLEGRTRPLPVYLPAELVEPLRGWLEAVYLPTKLIGFALEFHAWETSPGHAFTLDDGRLRVSVHPTTHLDGLRELIDPGNFERFLSYSLAFDWAESGKRLVYSADLGAPQDLAEILAVPCDLLVCEMSHFTPQELYGFLKDRPVPRLCLTHLSADYGAEPDWLRDLGAKTLTRAIDIRVMRDGDRIEF
jgi:ribonuclease Z